jgi:hypothetical protein
VYNRIIVTFSEIFLNVDCFKARIFQNILICKDIHVFVKGMLSLWVYNVAVCRAGFSFTSFIYSRRYKESAATPAQ